MTSHRLLGILALLWLFAFTAARVEAPSSNETLSGNLKCGFSTYAWPTSVDALPTSVGIGTFELVADGSGKFTSGTSDMHVGDDTHTSGSDACRFNLTEGTYSEGEGEGQWTARTAWALAPGSDTHCVALMSGQPIGWNTQDARAHSSVPLKLLFVRTSWHNLGVLVVTDRVSSMGTCQRAR